jgi:pilus assembly protein CpaE
MPDLRQLPDSSGAGKLSIALIGPDELHRKEISDALAAYTGGLEGQDAKRSALKCLVSIREFSSYPHTEYDNIPKGLDLDYDLVIIDLDSDLESALRVVKSVCALGIATVMVYTAQSSVELFKRSLHAGAREFLNLPLAATEMADALTRLILQRALPVQVKKAPRRTFVFLGAKGGCGVTTIASNFAVLLAQESGRSTLLIDLGLPLGDVAINLGMVPNYSTADALLDASRLDANFLSSLLFKHPSGLFVLAAPSEFTKVQPSLEAIDKLLSVARQSYNYVVVDAGSRVDLGSTTLFEESAIVYLVTQVGISELRNANRIIASRFSHRIHTLQTVLNRFAPHTLGFDDEYLTKALTRPAEWKIPDDYATARRTQNTGTPVALQDSPISRAIRQMARAACGLHESREKRKRFGLFG